MPTRSCPRAPTAWRCSNSSSNGNVFKDAWLTATGHDRPGMAAGTPLGKATRQAVEIGEQLHALLSPEP